MIGLAGALGAGKTQLVKGIASGNGLDDLRIVTSPTFTLVHEYPGRLHLYHADLYRLTRPAELTALGFEEWPRPDSAAVVEWADRMPALMPEDALWIELTALGPTDRRIVLRAGGGTGADCLARVRSSR